jgi:hypothetical protein
MPSNRWNGQAYLAYRSIADKFQTHSKHLWLVLSPVAPSMSRKLDSATFHAKSGRLLERVNTRRPDFFSFLPLLICHYLSNTPSQLRELVHVTPGDLGARHSSSPQPRLRNNERPTHTSHRPCMNRKCIWRDASDRRRQSNTFCITQPIC